MGFADGRGLLLEWRTIRAEKLNRFDLCVLAGPRSHTRGSCRANCVCGGTIHTYTYRTDSGSLPLFSSSLVALECVLFSSSSEMLWYERNFRKKFLKKK